MKRQTHIDKMHNYSLKIPIFYLLQDEYRYDTI